MIAASEVQTIPDARDPCQNQPMPLRRTLVTLVGVSLAVSVVLSGATTQMAIGEVRPGMVGIGHTVFDGTHDQQSKAHIIGVLENVIGTHRNLILAKLEGGPLANTGVIAGMSGSPVYIDGKLVGAVSYALGSFLEKAHRRHHTDCRDDRSDDLFQRAGAGRESQSRVPADARGAHRGVSQGPQLEPTVRGTHWRRAVERNQQRDGGSPAASSARCCGRLPHRSSCPASSRRLPTCSRRRFATRGSSRPAATPRRRRATARNLYEGPLKPGDAVGVMLVLLGDLQLGATGTVTHIDGDCVYAFGHPMDNLGPTEFPMTRADRLHCAAEPVLVDETVSDRRSDWHRAAGSCDRDCRPSRLVY